MLPCNGGLVRKVMGMLQEHRGLRILPVAAPVEKVRQRKLRTGAAGGQPRARSALREAWRCSLLHAPEFSDRHCQNSKNIRQEAPSLRLTRTDILKDQVREDGFVEGTVFELQRAVVSFLCVILLHVRALQFASNVRRRCFTNHRDANRSCAPGQSSTTPTP